MALLATVEGMEVRLGRPFHESERERAEAILSDVSAVALGETGADWDGDTAPAEVAVVVTNAALRVFKNPDRYIEQEIGSFRARVNADEFKAGLFTRAELGILQRNSQREGFGWMGFSTVQRVRDFAPGEVEYWETNIPGSPIPYSVRP